MKRLNITIDQETYENARIAAFLTKRNISAIIREALKEWFKGHKLLTNKALTLAGNEITAIKEVLDHDEFTGLDQVKKDLKL